MLDAGRTRSPRSASTPGAWTTACSLPRASSSTSRRATATRANAGDGARPGEGRGRRGVWRHRCADRPDQHGVLAAARTSPTTPHRLAGAATMLMMPDVIHHLLSGSTVTEYTAASTSGLLRHAGRPLGDRAARAARHPGAPDAGGGPAGDRRRRTARRLHRRPAPDAGGAPAAHDTASAVVGAPLDDRLPVHLLRHVVAGRGRGAAPDRDRDVPAREPDERGRVRRDGAAAAQRDGPVDPADVPPAMGERGPPPVLPRDRRPGRRGAGPGQRHRPRRAGLPRARGHAAADPGVLRPARDAGPGRHRRRRPMRHRLARHAATARARGDRRRHRVPAHLA